MEIVKSQNNNYYVKDQSAISDFAIYQRVKLAEKFGKHNITKDGFVTFPNKCDCKQFADRLEIIARIPSDLKEFLKNWGAYFLFCYNLNGGDPSAIATAFIWGSTPEGNKYWFNLSKKYDENKLQNTGTDRSRDNRSEGDRVCCKGNKSGFRLSYTQHRKTIDFQKRKVGDFKVNLSSRHSILL